MPTLTLIYNSLTKHLNSPPPHYQSLLSQTMTLFSASTLPPSFRFFYLDPADNDLVSVSCQEDLATAYSTPNLRLVIASSHQDALKSLSDLSVKAESLEVSEPKKEYLLASDEK